MTVFIHGIGVLGPGFSNWGTCQKILMESLQYDRDRRPEPFPSVLPSNERRRSSEVVRFALEAAQEAIHDAQCDPLYLPTVFASSGGETEILHKICHSLTQSPPSVSPTLFHQSVHNAAAGYWGIACVSHQSSVSLSCYDSTFAGGILEAATRLLVEPDDQVLLVAYDIAAPFPLFEARPLTGPFSVAFVLGKYTSLHDHGEFDLHLLSQGDPPETTMDDPELENLRAGNPAAHALPLLQALAKNKHSLVSLKFLDNLRLQITVRPCRLYYE